MPKLQILINHYREAPEVVEQLLGSIQRQTYTDYDVLMVTDGEAEALPMSLIERYPFITAYKALPHQGLSFARNVLLDMADAEYIMFIDADDCLYKETGIENIMATACEVNADMVSTDFLCEQPPKDGKHTCTPIQENLIWLQGKVFKLSYIRQHDIRFPEDKRIFTGGDMYFIWQAGNYSNNIIFSHDSFYLWRWNEASVTRCNEHFREWGYGSTILSYELLTRLLIERGHVALAQKSVASVFTMCYVDINKKDTARERAPQEYKDQQIAAAKAFIKKYGYYYLYARLDVRAIVYFSTARSRRLVPTVEGFDMMQEWIKGILLEVE